MDFTLDKKYIIRDITIKEYYEIQHILLENTVESKIFVISKISDCPTHILRDLGREEFLELWIVFIKDNLNLVKDGVFYQNFNYDNETYYFIDLDKLTVGEFVDLDIMNRDPNRNAMIHDMLSVLYRPFDGKDIIKYDSDELKERKEVFLNIPIKYAGTAFHYYFSYSNLLINKFKSLFDSEIEDDDTEPKHIRNARNWYSSIISCTNDDPTKFEEVTNLRVNAFFNYLAYRKDKINEENNNIE